MVKDLYIADGLSVETASEHLFLEALREILSLWALHLDLLQPDSINTSCDKFRSTLGWMSDGCVAVKDSIYCDLVRPLDPYALMPIQFRYEIESAELDFTHIRDGKHSLSEYSTDDRDQMDNPRDTSKSSFSEKCTLSSTGWKHRGHLDPETGIVDRSMEEETDIMQDAVIREEELLVPLLKHIVVAESPEEAHIAKGETKLSPYTVQKIRKEVVFCGNRGQCSKHRLDQDYGDDTILTLLEYLDADSPEMRDVVLAHVLVNGNVELLHKLMLVENAEEKQGGVATESEGGDTKSSRMDESAGPASPKQIRKPILPTLAHLRILQKLDRRPLPIFVDCILNGAPFQRGYVSHHRQ